MTKNSVPTLNVTYRHLWLSVYTSFQLSVETSMSYLEAFSDTGRSHSPVSLVMTHQNHLYRTSEHLSVRNPSISGRHDMIEDCPPELNDPRHLLSIMYEGSRGLGPLCNENVNEYDGGWRESMFDGDA